MKPVVALLQKELRLEMRQKHTLAGIFLYVLATVFVCYLSFGEIEGGKVWGGLVWLTGLFTAFNAMQKTFNQESNGVQFYLYSIAHPRHVILSKSIYNAFLIALLNLISLAFFALFFGDTAFAHAQMDQVLLGIFLGSTGLGFALTFVAGLAYKSDGGIGLIAILGFPVIIPLLVTITRFTTSAMEGAVWSTNSLNLLVLIVLNVTALLLALILFPYLWRE